jgi:hypothetical protein
MHKVVGGQSVGELFINTCISALFPTRSLLFRVRFSGFYYILHNLLLRFTGFILDFSHYQKSYFLSVKNRVIPVINSTYNKEQLIYINHIVVRSCV